MQQGADEGRSSGAVAAPSGRTAWPKKSLWTAFGVALAAVGCAPPGPRAPASATEGMRTSMLVGAPLDARVGFLRAGASERPLVVLVHGTPGSAASWADYLMTPPPGADVLALDRPGYGASDVRGAVPSLAVQAAAVIAMLPADERPVVLLGHSLGAPIVAWAAAVLAEKQPKRRVSIVMLAGSLDPGQESIHPLQRVGDWAAVSWLLPRVIRNANTELMALKPELEALGPMLPTINAKVVIVHGTKDDLVPVANVAYMQQRFTGARCTITVLLEGRNHFLPWNSEDAVRDALRVALEAPC